MNRWHAIRKNRISICCALDLLPQPPGYARHGCTSQSCAAAPSRPGPATTGGQTRAAAKSFAQPDDSSRQTLYILPCQPLRAAETPTATPCEMLPWSPRQHRFLNLHNRAGAWTNDQTHQCVELLTLNGCVVWPTRHISITACTTESGCATSGHDGSGPHRSVSLCEHLRV